MPEKDLDELKSIVCPACRVHLCELTNGHDVQVDDELYAHLNKVIFYWSHTHGIQDTLIFHVNTYQ
jgi:hypothetical protein